MTAHGGLAASQPDAMAGVDRLQVRTALPGLDLVIRRDSERVTALLVAVRGDARWTHDIIITISAVRGDVQGWRSPKHGEAAFVFIGRASFELPWAEFVRVCGFLGVPVTALADPSVAA